MFFFVADREDVRGRFQPLGDDQRRRTPGDQFADDVGARQRLQPVVVIDFLVAEHLDAAGVDRVQVADLVGRRGRIARDRPFAARKTGEPPQLQRFPIVVVQALDRQWGLQHGFLPKETIETLV